MLIACESSPTYIQVSDRFYQDTAGQLYIKNRGLAPLSESFLENRAEAIDGYTLSKPYFKPIPNIDLATYEQLETSTYYSKDKNHVYVEHQAMDGTTIYILKKADAASFIGLGSRWGKDKNYVFENGIPLEGLNPDSLVILDTLDKETFQYGLFSWVRDHQRLFYNYDEIDSVDISSLEILWDSIKKESYLMDKNWIYTSNEKKSRSSKE